MKRISKGIIQNMFLLPKWYTLFPVLLLLSVNALPADSIDNAGANNLLVAGAASAALIGGTPGTSPQGYIFFQSAGYSSPFDDPNFTGLGSAPGAFLFGPNNAFNFNGASQISILSTIGDPSSGTINLNDPNTFLYNFTFGDSGWGAADELQTGQIATTPEPGGIWFLGGGLAGMLVIAACSAVRAPRLPGAALQLTPMTSDR